MSGPNFIQRNRGTIRECYLISRTQLGKYNSFWSKKTEYSSWFDRGNYVKNQGGDAIYF
jgi:hypothetical protein